MILKFRSSSEDDDDDTWSCICVCVCVCVCACESEFGGVGCGRRGKSVARRQERVKESGGGREVQSLWLPSLLTTVPLSSIPLSLPSAPIFPRPRVSALCLALSPAPSTLPCLPPLSYHQARHPLTTTPAVVGIISVTVEDGVWVGKRGRRFIRRITVND